MTIDMAQAMKILNNRSVKKNKFYYVGLSKTILFNGLIGEVDAKGYSRVKIARSPIIWTIEHISSTMAIIRNSVSIEFNESKSYWGEIKTIFVSDSPTDGNILFSVRVDDPIKVREETVVLIEAGNLQIEVEVYE